MRKRTSNLGSSSTMGWVADVSSLCLDSKGKKEQETESKKEVSKRVSFNHRESQKDIFI